MGISMGEYSIYVHFPFCRSRCIYCDFVSNVVTPIPVKQVTEQVRRELDARRTWAGLRGAPLSIYFGGGTPSLWPKDALARVVRSCLDGADSNDIEVTVELNPGDVDEAWIHGMLAAGVNRFSVGVQAMRDDRLQWLGRRHTVADARAAVQTLRNCGASNISVDFIYATPGHTEADMVSELHALCGLEMNHISAYELTIAEGTPLFHMHPDDIADEQRAHLWHLAGETMARHGFERYEVSNYARGTTHRSRHNCHYWRGGTYLGLGAGAHGYVILGNRRIRYSNGATLSSWLDAPVSTASIAEKVFLGDGFNEILSDLDFARELVMLGLRCKDGVDVEQLSSLAGGQGAFREKLNDLVQEGWMVRQSHRLVPTSEAMLMADELALRFF